ncbi:MAG TPA: CAP domain-containing protein [Pyrinomonadaceae bacterium]
MKLITTLAILSALLLAGFLVLRPRLSEIGKPRVPDTSGRARRHVPDGTTAHTSSEPASSGSTSPATVDTTGIEHPEAIEKLVLELVNENRRKAGGDLKDLSWDETLLHIAREHSDDMLARRFFDHVNPDGLSAADRIALAHRQLVGLTGENIFMLSGYAETEVRKTAELIVRELMASPGHRENILRPEFSHLGVGVSIRGGELRTTQNFALIRALVDQPIPREVKSGEVLHLGTTPGAEKYDFWLSSSGMQVGESVDIGDGTVRVQPGVYKVRFYFPTASGYTLFMGPQVEVK